MLDSAADDHAEAQSTDTPPPKKRGRGKGVRVVEREGVLGKECRACGAEWLPLGAFSKGSKVGGRHSQCRVCANAVKARWNANNVERRKVKSARWQADNADRAKLNVARWKEANPAKIATYAALRLERFREAGPDLPHHIKLQIWEVAEGLCEYCGVPVPAPHARSHMEHRVPLTRGGTNALENRGVACKRCQSRKGTRTLSEWVDYDHMIALANCT